MMGVKCHCHRCGLHFELAPKPPERIFTNEHEDAANHLFSNIRLLQAITIGIKRHQEVQIDIDDLYFWLANIHDLAKKMTKGLLE